MRSPKPATLSLPQKRLLSASVGLLWLTGALWLYLEQGNTARPLCMQIHGALAMLFLMLFGALLLDHVPMGWKQNEQRPSGVSVLAVCGVLVVTGWGLYYFGGEPLRRWTHWIHSVLGLLLPVIIFIHVRKLWREKNPS